MINFIRDRIKHLNKDERTVIGNFLSLSTLEIVNYMLPLITFPYLVRVLGPEKFGIVALAQAFASYFMWFVDYGFCLSAPREISIHRDEPIKVVTIYSSIITTKTILMLIALAIYLGIIFIFRSAFSDTMVFIFSFGYIVGDVLFPVWFFQGIERMKIITVMYIIARTFFLLTVFVIIKSAADYVYVPLLNSIGIIIAGLISQVIIAGYFHVLYRIPSFRMLRTQLKNSWHFFVSSISMTIYTNSNPLILGLLAGKVYVGYFAAGEKIVRCLQRFIVAFSISLYPRVNKLASENKIQTFRILRKVLITLGITLFFVSFLIFIFKKPIVILLLGKQYEQSIIVLAILAFLPFIIAIGNVFGYQTMPAFNMKEIFSKILFMAAIFHLMVAAILVILLKHIGAAIALLATETMIAFVSFLYLNKKELRFWQTCSCPKAKT